jgi:hypothetical protein
MYTLGSEVKSVGPVIRHSKHEAPLRFCGHSLSKIGATVTIGPSKVRLKQYDSKRKANAPITQSSLSPPCRCPCSPKQSSISSGSFCDTSNFGTGSMTMYRARFLSLYRRANRVSQITHQTTRAPCALAPIASALVVAASKVTLLVNIVTSGGCGLQFAEPALGHKFHVSLLRLISQFTPGPENESFVERGC